MDSGEKVLIFTQFKEMGKLLSDIITERFTDRPLFYHGGCSLVQRQEMVERFQGHRADKIFILSLKAASIGLNLTAASAARADADQPDGKQMPVGFKEVSSPRQCRKRYLCCRAVLRRA